MTNKNIKHVHKPYTNTQTEYVKKYKKNEKQNKL